MKATRAKKDQKRHNESDKSKKDQKRDKSGKKRDKSGEKRDKSGKKQDKSGKKRDKASRKRKRNYFPNGKRDERAREKRLSLNVIYKKNKQGKPTKPARKAQTTAN